MFKRDLLGVCCFVTGIAAAHSTLVWVWILGGVAFYFGIHLASR